MFISFDTIVPSKRVRYKQNEQKHAEIIALPRGSIEFENHIKNNLTPKPKWPYKGRILIALQIMIKESDYKCKDIDNVTKSIIDAMKGIVYEDDVQIDMVHVQKIKSKKYSFAVGIKELDNDDTNWYFPRLFGEEEFSEEQTFTLTAKYKIVKNS